MKTLSFALLLMAGMAVVLLGCSDNSNPAMTAGAQLGQQPAITSLPKGGIVNSVTGSAHWRSVPVTGQTNVRFEFSAIKHANGTFSGEVQCRDAGPMLYGHGTVYDLKVSGNIAKFAFRFTHGNLAVSYPGTVFGWCVAIDNGEGVKATGPDLVSMILFTDGSDIPITVGEIDVMEPQEYLDWMKDVLLPLFGVSYDEFLSPYDNGSVKVR